MSYGKAIGTQTYPPLKINSGFTISRDHEETLMIENKQKKPGFFKRWLYKVAEEAWNHKRLEEREDAIYANKLVSARSDSPSLNSDRAIRFNVYLATGGRIVEVARYDRQKDRHIDGMYVITNDQDFGREIDKILTMEHLK